MKMLHMLLLLLLTAFLSVVAHAKDIGLRWNANPPDDNVTRYEVTYHTGPGTAPVVLNVPGLNGPNTAPTRVDVKGLAEGVTYYFVVRAANADGISDPSDEISYRVPKPPVKPAGLQVVEVQVSSNLTDWETLAYVPLKADSPARFIRTQLTELNLTP